MTQATQTTTTPQVFRFRKYNLDGSFHEFKITVKGEEAVVYNTLDSEWAIYTSVAYARQYVGYWIKAGYAHYKGLTGVMIG